MSVKDWMRAKVSTPPSYRCEHCGLTFDEERLNCPACGFDVDEV